MGLSAALVLLLAGGTSAQQWEPLTPEEVARRQARAGQAPLFASEEPLRLTLRTDISRLRRERPDEEEIEGEVSYADENGSEVLVPVKVRTRGNFRRERRNCDFPPLRLNFAGEAVEGTAFEGQDKLKLVTPCRESRRDYQRYVLQEYLIYRTYRMFSPVGFRVRLLEITYEDPDGGYDTRTVQAFLIEADEAMAARNRARLMEREQFHPAAMDGAQSTLVALFQYMIGNTDFSGPFFHNAVMVLSEDGRYLLVPYDFDFSGAVDARYATPDPKLPISSVRQRVFRGFCRDDVDHAALAETFNAHRQEIEALYRSFPGLEDGDRRRVLKYYDQFYDVLNDPRKYEREIIRACRSMG